MIWLVTLYLLPMLTMGVSILIQIKRDQFDSPDKVAAYIAIFCPIVNLIGVLCIFVLIVEDIGTVIYQKWKERQ